jgi:2,3-bisphosphoglycerate-independent phosphoglycerate mutase
LGTIGCGRVATVMGRYYAMDRDNRWERVEKAYNAMVLGQGACRASSAEAIQSSYGAGVHDEFVLPCVICDAGTAVGTVNDGDGIIFFNFRSDRAREITRSLTFKDFDGFQRQRVPQLSGYVCMTEYDATFGLPIAYAQQELTNLLGGVAGRGRPEAVADCRD